MEQRTLEIISDDDVLYRRIVPMHIKPDGTISSSAYMNRRKKPDCEISVDLARLCSGPGETRSREGKSGFGVGELVARLPRCKEVGMDVRHAPLDGNETHSLIEGENTGTKCSILARGTTLILPPPPREPVV